MTQLHNTIAIDASPDAVWCVLGDLTAVTQWVPGIVDAKVEGDRRVCKTGDGGEIHERISDYAAAARAYRYAHTRTPMPVQNSRGHLTVTPADDGAQVVWDAEFEVMDTSQEAAIAAMIDGAFKQALESLRDRVEQTSRQS